MEQIKEMWQVCELEESVNIRLTHFERFSVSAVPESWNILRKDGTLWCFWPSVDAASKIRSLYLPKVGEKGKYYKCRILLDGAKFSSYEKAEKAVQIAQNVSSIMDSSVLMRTQKIENARNSAMNFDVDEYANGSENNDDIVERDNSGFDVEDDTEEENDTDDGNGEIVGNDSFEFNKAILKGGRYLSKEAMTFEVEDLGNSPIDVNDTGLSENFNYHAKFQSNDANFSTSTAVDDLQFQQTIEKSEIIMLKISAIEMKVSLFMESLQEDLNDLKREIKAVQEKKDFYAISSFNGDGSNVQREEKVMVLLSSESATAFVEDVQYKNVLNETFLAESAYVSKRATDTFNLNDQSSNILNTTTSPGNGCDESNVQRESNGLNNSLVLKSINESVHNNESSNILSIPIDVELQAEANLIDKVAEPHDNPGASTTDELRFPYDELADHIRNEDLLGEPAFDAALIQFLEPFSHEDEAIYIERSVEKLFTDNFFLNRVSWRKEPNRMNIKSSKLLCCWKTSFQNKFGMNIDDAKLQQHFRRFKGRKRAQIKAQRKRSAKAKPISVKK